MQYIIMCGGDYPKWEEPRQLIDAGGEALVERTIRLLRENGVEHIAISSNDTRFNRFGVPLMIHKNEYRGIKYNDSEGNWCDCFYPTDLPCCYLFGDVLFSPEAIRKIVGYQTDDIMLFGSKPPFSNKYPKVYIEPFAFKVENQKHLHEAIKEVKMLDQAGEFKRRPIAWEVWSVIRGSDPNGINYSYEAINDYTCDIDYPNEINEVIRFLS